jgi:type VI secretion system protein ImpK
MAADDHTLPQDPDHTILMPAPGGQPTLVLQRPAPARAVKSSAGVDLQRLVAGVNPLLGAAGVPLALVAQLRATTAHADPAALREQLLERVAEFEALAAANGVPRPQVSAARYLLCSFLDEVIAATPWGAGGAWGQRNLLQEFHEERWGGDKAFELLERLGEDVSTNADLLELFYVCIALGFEGRYRGRPDGRERLDAIAERVLQVLHPADAPPSSRTLSLQWQGVATRGNRDVSVLPLWVLAAIGAGLLLGVVLLAGARLDALATPAFKRIHALPSLLSVDRGTTLAAKERLAPALRDDIARGTLAVRDEALRSLLTLPADALFVAGSASIEPKQLPLLARVAQALASTPGQVSVIGHTDDAPTASLQFPSNWHLSRERAQAVMDALAQQGVSRDRLHAEGRAEVEPLVPNTTPAQRARNRRIEIELRLPRPEQ